MHIYIYLPTRWWPPSYVCWFIIPLIIDISTISPSEIRVMFTNWTLSTGAPPCIYYRNFAPSETCLGRWVEETARSRWGHPGAFGRWGLRSFLGISHGKIWPFFAPKKRGFSGGLMAWFKEKNMDKWVYWFFLEFHQQKMEFYGVFMAIMVDLWWQSWRSSVGLIRRIEAFIVFIGGYKSTNITGVDPLMAKLVNIIPISLWFMIHITYSIHGVDKPTNITGGHIVT